jgi:hypothetical protein
MEIAVLEGNGTKKEPWKPVHCLTGPGVGCSALEFPSMLPGKSDKGKRLA